MDVMDKSKTTTGKLHTLRTKHKETEAELRRYKVLVENVQDYAIFFMDKTGHIKTWNKGAENNKGYTASEIIGKHFSIFYPEVDKAANKPAKELEIAVRYGRVEDEGWRVRKDGSMFWANVVITALHDDDGELIGFAKVTRNLTERKKQEDILRAANAELETQQAELRMLNTSKDDFISLASHQLRTPATAVKQLLGIMMAGMAGELTPKQQDLIKKAYDSNERQLAIVNSLLSVAQIDANKVVLRKSWKDLDTLLDEVVDEQSESIIAKKQTIKVTPLDIPVDVYVDTQYLGMAIGNIIDNASKYTKNEGEIKVCAKRNKDKITITIEDNGVGVSAENLEHLFEKFKRISNEFSDLSSGSGLGLYWVEKVIELHNGTIEVESELGKGTTFNITIPIGEKDA
jgi:PAS domain S-box-containing protein